MKRVAFLSGAATLLAAAPRPGGPVSLKVYHVRNDVMTGVAITPGRLVSFPRVSVHDVRDPNAIQAALAAVHAAAPRATGARDAHDVDCRWGLLFAHADGRRHAVYTDRFGVKAVIDGTREQFAEATLAPWLAKHYGPA
jgi:hypothetical protein